MTNEEMWIIERMKDLSSFQGRLEEIEMRILGASKEQKEALNTLYGAIDGLVSADAWAIGEINDD